MKNIGYFRFRSGYLISCDLLLEGAPAGPYMIHMKVVRQLAGCTRIPPARQPPLQPVHLPQQLHSLR